ncbi:MAG: twin-arginine translocase TatA/TatE family subunit [Alphaproteobacteria bacterium]|nr:twin-arginine translocase TatA/TatE family subunit [Alphaproteobacteria bacterium]MCW5750266.1 twin-arginine translocase TatA/TatE family subunit [Alphaproteobacteria bacterium]
MGTFSIWHWLVVLVVVLLVFGARKLPSVATDLAQGIKNFKKGLADKEEPKPIENASGQAREAQGSEQATKDKVA